MDRQAEIEAWIATLDPPRLPTEPEIELWEWFADIAALEDVMRTRIPSPPDGGDALDLFVSQGSEAER